MKTINVLSLKKLLLSATLFSAISLHAQQPELQINKLKPVFQTRELQASPALKTVLTQQRSFIANNKLNFQVANTQVSEMKLSEITGEASVPENEVTRIKSIMTTRTISPEVIRVIGTIRLKPVPTQKAYDARKDNLVPAVRTQHCGNCWTYSAIGPIECSHIRINGAAASSVDLSEKQALACSGGGDCGGGFAYKVFTWLENTGTKVMNDANAPDNGTDKPCPAVPASANVQVLDWGVIDPSGDISKIAPVGKIKEAICKYGPIAVSLNATPLLQNYAGGVFFETASNYASPSSNHAVMIVGWDDDKQAWLMRNSWGTNWGEDGYGWISYNTNNIGRRAAWVVVKKQ